MGLIGTTLIVAVLVHLAMYPRKWLDLVRPLAPWQQEAPQEEKNAGGPSREPASPAVAISPPVVDVSPPIIQTAEETDDDEDDPTTPKAAPTPVAAGSSRGTIPALSLAASDADRMPPPMFPAASSAQRASSSGPSGAQRMGPPPPPPPPPQMRPPALGAGLTVPGSGAAAAAAARRPNLPVPNRGPGGGGGGGGGGLAPPPSTQTRPAKPSGRHKVMLTPGHSPLDWARLSGDARANLRNLPADAPPVLRVTPSQLRTMNGRRGRDAWTALGGMVYNITPYLPFHPGGEGELLRCAGRDGNRLFQQVHGWVNYDNMLAACRIGILVDEHEAAGPGPMEEMD